MANKIINIDLDGVVYPFQEQFLRFVYYETGRQLKKSSQWECWEDYNMTREEWHNWCKRAIDSGMLLRLGEPIQDSAETLIMLSKELDYRIRIVTNRMVWKNSHADVASSTMRWLDENNIRVDDLCFIADKWQVKGDYFIEDSPENLKILKKKWKGQVMKFVQPWNTDAPCDVWFRSWKHIGEYFRLQEYK